MDGKTSRLFLFVTACSIVGVLLGGTASRAEVQQCLVDETPTSECLTQDPTTRIVEGMGFGLLAGAGAAIGSTWQMWLQKDH